MGSAGAAVGNKGIAHSRERFAVHLVAVCFDAEVVLRVGRQGFFPVDAHLRILAPTQCQAVISADIYLEVIQDAHRLVGGDGHCSATVGQRLPVRVLRLEIVLFAHNRLCRGIGAGRVDKTYDAEPACVVALWREWRRLQVFVAAEFIVDERIFAVVDTLCRGPIITRTILPAPWMYAGIKNHIVAGTPCLLGWSERVTRQCFGTPWGDAGGAQSDVFCVCRDNQSV